MTALKEDTAEREATVVRDHQAVNRRTLADDMTVDDDYDDYHDGHHRRRQDVRYETHRHRDYDRRRYDTSSESNYRRGTRRPREPSYPPDRAGHSMHRHPQPSSGAHWTNTRARTPGHLENQPGY